MTKSNHLNGTERRTGWNSIHTHTHTDKHIPRSEMDLRQVGCRLLVVASRALVNRIWVLNDRGFARISVEEDVRDPCSMTDTVAMIRVR